MHSDIGNTIIKDIISTETIFGSESAAPKLPISESVEWINAENANATRVDHNIDSVCFIFSLPYIRLTVELSCRSVARLLLFLQRA